MCGHFDIIHYQRNPSSKNIHPTGRGQQKSMKVKTVFQLFTEEVKKSSYLFVMVVAEWRLLGSGAVPLTDGLFHVRVSAESAKHKRNVLI